jgi:hypothetical protein
MNSSCCKSEIALSSVEGMGHKPESAQSIVLNPKTRMIENPRTHDALSRVFPSFKEFFPNQIFVFALSRDFLPSGVELNHRFSLTVTPSKKP